jgi:hypothetical protein
MEPNLTTRKEIKFMYLVKQPVRALLVHKRNVYEWRNTFGFVYEYTKAIVNIGVNWGQGGKHPPQYFFNPGIIYFVTHLNNGK